MTAHEMTPAARAGAHRGQGNRCDGDELNHTTPTTTTPDLTDMARSARADWISAARRLAASGNPEARHEVRALRLWAREVALAAAAAASAGGDR